VSRIGDKQVVHFASLIVPEKESAWVEFSLGNWVPRINIVFETKPPAEGQPAAPAGISLEPVGDYGKMVFTNWDNALGAATTAPFELGKSNDGKTISVMVWHIRTGSVHRLDLQFLVS
jgi:hypothetical protein